MDAVWPFAHGAGSQMAAGPFSERIVIGRDPTADVQIAGPEDELLYVSRHHLVVDFKAGRWFATSIGRYGWELAATARRPLATAASGVPYPVVDGMRVRVPDNRWLPRRARPRRRPLLTLAIDATYGDTRETPEARPDGDAAAARRARELWERDDATHQLAVHLLRHRNELPSTAQLQDDLGVAHGTLYNRLGALERHLGVQYDGKRSGGRTKAAFLAEALAADPVFGTLPIAPATT